MKKIRTYIQTEKNTHTQRKYIYINILKDIYIRRGKPRIHKQKINYTHTHFIHKNARGEAEKLTKSQKSIQANLEKV